MGERVPQHIQNIVIRNYCQNSNYEYLLSATEYAMPDCHMVLKQTILESENFDGIVLYSLFQLPENTTKRFLMVKELLDKKKQLHCAVENIQIDNINDFNNIDQIWQIKKTI